MYEFRTIASQSTRRGGIICNTCSKRLIRQEHSNSRAPSQSKELSQTSTQPLYEGKERKFGLAVSTLPPGGSQKLEGPSRGEHPPTLPHGSKTYAYPAKTTLRNGRKAPPPLLSAIRPSFNTEFSQLKTHPLTVDKEPPIQNSFRLQYVDPRFIIRHIKLEGSQSGEQPSRSRIRNHLSKGSRTIDQISATLSSIERTPGKASPAKPTRLPNITTCAPGSTRQPYSTSARARAVEVTTNGSSNIQFPSSAMNMNIREKLSQFQKDLDGTKAKDKAALELALSRYTLYLNTTTSEGTVDEEDHDLEDRQEMDPDGSIANVRPQLEPGDLIELPSFIEPYLAVVTGVFPVGSTRHVQFLDCNSAWGYKVFPIGNQPTFAIKHFFKMSELTSIKCHLPSGFLPSLEPGQEQHKHGILQAEISSSVLEKIQMFQKDANGIYQQHAARIDGAFELLAQPNETIFMSLEEITRKVLYIKESHPVREEISYAVHKACTINNAGFLLDQYHWHSRQFEILSKKEAETIEHIQRWTRERSEDMVKRLNREEVSNKSILDIFADEIRPVVLKNRKNRESLTGGHLGPSKQQLDELQGGNLSYKSVLGPSISRNSLPIFEFLKMWADRKYNHRGRRLMLGLASEVLKSTGLYDDDILVQHGGSLSLLKECGVMPPWQAPGYLSGRSSDPYPDENAPGSKLFANAQKEIEAEQLQIDSMVELRHDFGEMLVFCIDSSSTIDVDDGVSLERTSEHGTYWIHVHIANPTAFISQDSNISQLAQFLRSSIYLPDQVHRMLPFNLIREKLSLQPGRPTLTISTKINMDGVILDRQVRNGFINNVLHITPDMLDECIGDTFQSSGLRNNFVVGHFAVPATECERSTSTLSVEAINELQIMKKLGDAWITREAKARNHNWSFGNMSRPSINVYHQKREHVDTTHFRQFFGDPTISLSASPWDPHSNFPITQKRRQGLVESLMQLANNSAAEWCAQRGVPTLYRGCSFGIRRDLNAEAARPFQNSGNIAADFQEYCRRCSNLLIDARPELSIRKISHEIIGVDAYMSATSPLRRYDDMINHWQIEAVLREEARLGRPMVEHDFCRFPFPEDLLKKEIAKSTDMSRIHVSRNHRAVSHWRAEFLTRGILFGECKDLPETFTLYIIDAGESTLRGMIAELSMMTALRADQISTMSEPPEVGQIWKVKPKKEFFYSHEILWQLIDRVT